MNSVMITEEEIKKIKYIAGCIYGDASSLTSGNVSHYRTPIMKHAEEIINIIEKEQ